MTAIAIVPADAATGIAPGTSVVAVFSRPLDCTTVTSRSVTLAAGTNDVAGTVNCSGSALSFVPDAALANGTYTMRISGIAGTHGEALVTAVTSHFTTASPTTANRSTIGGTVTGLGNGRGLTLQLNASDALSVTTSGTFVFPTTLAEGAAYQVSVLSQPSDQTCAITDASGIVRAATIAVAVSCATNTYTVSAVLSGLGAGRTITLRNNGGDEVTFSSNGALTFRTPLAPLSSYDVAIAAQPMAQTCSVANGRGTVGLADVSGIEIRCVENRYSIGFQVKGLRTGDPLAVTIVGSDHFSLIADASLTSISRYVYGTAYDVVIASQPDFQTCTVANGSGVVRDADVTNVTITCAPAVAPAASTLGVAYGLKQLRFSWPAVSGATYYKLMSTPDGIAPFTQTGADVAGTHLDVDVGVHLVDWVNARYRIDACNPIGCTPSAPVDAVAGAASTVGYFKSPNADTGDQFGFVTALSGDGRTLAVGALGERSASTGVNGDPNDDSLEQAGAVYVFTRDSTVNAGSTNGWRLQAYLKPSNVDLFMSFGISIALDGDGSHLAVGAPFERGCSTHVGGAVTGPPCPKHGAVYVFERRGDVWRQQAYVKGRRPNDDSGTEQWLFGAAVALDASGETLVVGEPFDEFIRSGIVMGAEPAAPAAHSFGLGATYVFTRTRDAWTQEAYAQASNNTPNDLYSRYFGAAVAISRDGDTVAVGAPGESSATSFAVNGSSAYDCLAQVNCALASGAVYVLRRTRSNGGIQWAQEAYLKSLALPDIHFGGAWNVPFPFTNYIPSGQLALDEHGDTLAIAVSSVQTVYVYARTGSTWASQAQLLAPFPTVDPFVGSANNMAALSADGNLLAVSGGDAVKMYRRAGGAWSLISNAWRPPLSASADAFGASLAMSDDGSTIAVGARYEEGSATTVQGDQAARSLPQSGAVYVY